MAEISPYTCITIFTCIIFGILAVIRDFSDEQIEKYKKNFISRYIIAKYMKNGQRIHRAIGESLASGDLKGSLKFAGGLIYLFFYFFIVNLFLNLVKLIIFMAFGVFAPNFFEGFSFMLGAGLTSFLLWYKSMDKQSKEITDLLRHKKIAEGTKNIISQGTKFFILLYAFLIWVAGEFLFLAFSPTSDELMQFFYLIVVAALIVFIILFLIGSLIKKH